MRLCSSWRKEEGLHRKVLFLVFFLLPFLYIQSKSFVSLYKDHSWITYYEAYAPFVQNPASQDAHTLSNTTNENYQHPYDSLPKWMTLYFQWHSQQLELIRNTNQDGGMDPWRHHKLLLVRCMDDDRCGGTSDRLKSLPLFLILAAQTKRLLFLRWNRPFALEEFLIPNDHQQNENDLGKFNYFWNWTVPDSLATILDKGLTDDGPYNQTTILSKKSQQLVSATQNPSIWLVQGNLQFSGGALYETLCKEVIKQEEQTSGGNIEAQNSDFTTLYHYFFHATFAPAPGIRSIVDDLFQRLHLQPNRFVVVHIRAKYPGEVFRETHNLTALEEIVENAICIAKDLTPEPMPIYLASDAMPVLQAGMKHSHVVSLLSSAPQNEEQHDPPHLNFAQKEDPAAFYSIFVDLIVMSRSRCVTFGAGGFGRFGSLVSYDVGCRKPHTVKGKMQPCNG